MGCRSEDVGYSFCWLNKTCPCFITPNHEIILLDVRANVPYLTKDGVNKEYPTQPERQIMCGVYIKYGVVTMCVDDLTAATACPAEASGD